MTGDHGESAALKPLWALVSGSVLGSATAIWVPDTGPGWLHLLFVLIGLCCFALAAANGHRAPILLWTIAGLALTGGHALHLGGDRRELSVITQQEDPLWVRARLVVTEGWSEGRWGWRTRVGVLAANHHERKIPDLSRCRLEIRGSVRPRELPPPGSIIDGLVSIRGSPRSPLLVASSHRLVESAGSHRPLPVIRDRLAASLLSAAGTDVDRIRAAELAAALSLGRRDLLPKDNIEGWRRSGLSHVLAVSGLHVGLVAGMTWLLLMAGGVSPTTARVVTFLVLPTYALLAGAAPSAVRAALMGMIYLAALLMGRAIVPMAAVLLTVFLLLVADPSLIAEVSFQLTVLVTAALVRWAPRLAAAIPLPHWAAVAVAVPVIAQLAAAPVVAFHFGSAVPGAVGSNLLVPWLLGPIVVSSVAATAMAQLWTAASGWLLEIVDLGASVLWWSGTPGRAIETVPPAMPLALLIALAIFGIASLLPGKPGRRSLALYLASIVITVGWWQLIPASDSTEIELLPVSHGLALRASSGETHLLMDGGGFRRECAEMLAPSRIRRLAAVIASHGDEDHIGGLQTVFRTNGVDELVLPVWLTTSADAVPLMRTARRRGVRIIPVARGSRIALGSVELEVLWPPASGAPGSENERSLVARLLLGADTVLLTADIGRATENRLVATTSLHSSLVVVPHHGSRNSATPAFLEASGARTALIPAGPENLHHHPHPEVLDRLDEHGIDYRMPIRDGRCGARLVGGGWVLYPEVVNGEW